MKYFSAFTLFLALLSATGCSSFEFPGVYKLSIPQGNVVDQDMVDRLKPGMTKSQVRFILGTPLLQDSFMAQRWDYHYSLLKADGDTVVKQLSVHFDNQDRMSRLSGDWRPDNGAVVQQPEPEPLEEPVTPSEIVPIGR